MPSDVDTFGWSTVYAASFPVVNAAITKQKSFPRSFNYTDATNARLAGDWESWQLSGGGGQYLQLTCVVKSGSISGLAQPEGSGNLQAAKVIIQVQMEKIKQQSAAFEDATAVPGTGVAHILKVKYGLSDNEPAVTVMAGSTYPQVTSELFKDLVGGILAKWFNANISEFAHVFGVLLVDEEAANGDYAWLKPTDLSYAIGGSVGQNLALSVLGILCLTDGAKVTPGMQQAVDVGCLLGQPATANSAFVISAEKFTEHVLFKGAVNSVTGSKVDDWKIQEDKVSISNVKPVLWGHFETKGGIVSPQLQPGNFVLSVEGDHILLEVTDATWYPQAGVTCRLNMNQRIHLKGVKRASDGKWLLLVDTDLQSYKPSIHVNVEIAEWLKWVEIAVAIVGAVAGLAAGFSAAGAALEGALVAVEEAGGESLSLTMEGWANFLQRMGREVAEGWAKDSAESVDLFLTGAAEFLRGGFFISSTFRLLAGVTAAIAGVGALAAPISQMVQQGDLEKIPPFDTLAQNIIGAAQWPSMKDVELVSLDLRSSIVIGTKLLQA